MTIPVRSLRSSQFNAGLAAGEHSLSCVQGSGRAYYAPGPKDYDQMFLSLSESSGFCEKKLTTLFLVLDVEAPRVGLVLHVGVSPKARGQGGGSELMRKFKEQIGEHTDVDFVLASVEIGQAEGFSLRKFYEDRGFEPVMFSHGELLMANKGWARKLKEYLQPPRPAPEMGAHI